VKRSWARSGYPTTEYGDNPATGELIGIDWSAVLAAHR
jgi:hypothetical protein